MLEIFLEDIFTKKDVCECSDLVIFLLPSDNYKQAEAVRNRIVKLKPPEHIKKKDEERKREKKKKRAPTTRKLTLSSFFNSKQSKQEERSLPLTSSSSAVDALVSPRAMPALTISAPPNTSFSEYAVNRHGEPEMTSRAEEILKLRASVLPSRSEKAPEPIPIPLNCDENIDRIRSSPATKKIIRRTGANIGAAVPKPPTPKVLKRELKSKSDMSSLSVLMDRAKQRKGSHVELPAPITHVPPARLSSRPRFNTLDSSVQIPFIPPIECPDEIPLAKFDTKSIALAPIPPPLTVEEPSVPPLASMAPATTNSLGQPLPKPPPRVKQ